MGFFSKKKDEDFISQLYQEEGSYTEFEQENLEQISSCVDSYNSSKATSDNHCETHNTTPIEQRILSAVSPAAKNIEKNIQKLISHTTQNKSEGDNLRVLLGIIFIVIGFFSPFFLLIGIIVLAAKNNKK